MIKALTTRLSLTALLLLTSLASNAAQPLAPLQVIKTSTDNIIVELQKKPKSERTPKFIRQLVMEHIVPVVDERRIAKSALGKHWDKASEAQRTQFMQRFLELQIRSYTGAFQAFNGEKMSFQGAKYNKNRTKSLVAATLKQNNGYDLPLEFRLYQLPKTSEWKVYDAKVAGFGMVQLYRAQVAERLKSISMDELIAELAQR